MARVETTAESQLKHTQRNARQRKARSIKNNNKRANKKDKNIPESWANCPHSRHF